MTASAMRQVEVALAAPQAEAALYQALLAAGLTTVHGGAGTLRASGPMSWASWGEDVTATTSHGPRGAVVTIRSVSSMPLTLVDWGRNASVVERVVRELALRAPVL